MMSLSVVIPAYNEENRISSTLSNIYNYLETRDYEYEVILIDDGSADDTVLKVEACKLADDNKLKLIKNVINRGKGYSIKEGILNSTGAYVLLCDADLSAPIEEANKLFEYINKGYDVVVGSRSVNGADIKVHQPWYREGMGKVFNFFVKLLVLKGFCDTQCGFKLIKGGIARQIAPNLVINGFSFDVELLYIAKKMGYRIKEVGIIWNNSPQSRVKIFTSSLNMFCDLFKIKSVHG